MSKKDKIDEKAKSDKLEAGKKSRVGSKLNPISDTAKKILEELKDENRTEITFDDFTLRYLDVYKGLNLPEVWDRWSRLLFEQYDNALDYYVTEVTQQRIQGLLQKKFDELLSNEFEKTKARFEEDFKKAKIDGDYEIALKACLNLRENAHIESQHFLRMDKQLYLFSIPPNVNYKHLFFNKDLKKIISAHCDKKIYKWLCEVKKNGMTIRLEDLPNDMNVDELKSLIEDCFQQFSSQAEMLGVVCALEEKGFIKTEKTNLKERRTLLNEILPLQLNSTYIKTSCKSASTSEDYKVGFLSGYNSAI